MKIFFDTRASSFENLSKLYLAEKYRKVKQSISNSITNIISMLWEPNR